VGVKLFRVPVGEWYTELLWPERLWRSAEVLGRPCPVPAAPGVYAWYVRPPVPGIPVDGAHRVDGYDLVYVGISPKRPSGERPSRQTLRSRVRYHCRGNAAGSTLRLTLGCLLSEHLGIELRRVGSGTRLTFGPGESVLSDWIGEHARVCWLPTPEPWGVESTLIHRLDLPLNLDQNRAGSFWARLSALRAEHRGRARALPVL
jgi:hypothetical protein